MSLSPSAAKSNFSLTLAGPFGKVKECVSVCGLAGESGRKGCDSARHKTGNNSFGKLHQIPGVFIKRTPIGRFKSIDWLSIQSSH